MLIIAISLRLAKFERLNLWKVLARGRGLNLVGDVGGYLKQLRVITYLLRRRL